MVPPFHGFQGSQISDPLLSNPVTIDGKWTTADEWSDASVNPMTVYCYSVIRDAKAFVYAKHDNSSLYFLVDFVSALSIKGFDFAAITIQPSHAGGQYPQSDDLRFDSKYPSGGIISRYSPASSGVGGNWKSFVLPPGVIIAMSISDSPNQVQPHEITEFQIPLSIFSKMQETVGFRVSAGYGNGSSYTAVAWPLGTLPLTPETWGELTILPNAMPQSTAIQMPSRITLGLSNNGPLTQIEKYPRMEMMAYIKTNNQDVTKDQTTMDF